MGEGGHAGRQIAWKVFWRVLAAAICVYVIVVAFFLSPWIVLGTFTILAQVLIIRGVHGLCSPDSSNKWALAAVAGGIALVLGVIFTYLWMHTG